MLKGVLSRTFLLVQRARSYGLLRLNSRAFIQPITNKERSRRSVYVPPSLNHWCKCIVTGYYSDLYRMDSFEEYLITFKSPVINGTDRTQTYKDESRSGTQPSWIERVSVLCVVNRAPTEVVRRDTNRTGSGSLSLWEYSHLPNVPD